MFGTSNFLCPIPYPICLVSNSISSINLSHIVFIIAAPVGVVHSPFTLLNFTGTSFHISTTAGAGTGITPCAHLTKPEPSGTFVAYISSTHSKSNYMHDPTISMIESIAPTS